MIEFKYLWHKDRENGEAERALMKQIYDLRYNILRKPLNMARTEPFPRGLLLYVVSLMLSVLLMIAV